MSEAIPALERMPSVSKRTGMSVGAIYKLVREGRFPKWIRIGSNSFWDRREIDAWIEARLADGRQESLNDSAKFAQLGRRSVAARRRRSADSQIAA
jgi:prophage regulatory protein